MWSVNKYTLGTCCVPGMVLGWSGGRGLGGHHDQQETWSVPTRHCYPNERGRGGFNKHTKGAPAAAAPDRKGRGGNTIRIARGAGQWGGGGREGDEGD